MVEVVAIVIGLRGVAAQQVVVAEGCDLGAGRSLQVRSVGPEVDEASEGGDGCTFGKAVLIFAEAGHTLLVVVCLVPVGEHLVACAGEAGLLGRSDRPGIEVEREHARFERTVRSGGPDVWIERHSTRKQVYGPAEVRGPDGGGGAGAAVEIHAGDELAGEK